MTPQEGTRKVKGSLFRAYVTGLERLGLLEAVRAAAPPRVRALMEAPPLHSTWLRDGELAELLDTVLSLHGRDAVRRLGSETTRATTLKLLRPMLRTALAVGGGGPEALFFGVNAFTRIFIDGVSFRFQHTAPAEGQLELRSSYAMGESLYAAWEGTLSLLFEECGVRGTIEPTRVTHGGHLGTMRVSW